MIYIVIVKSNFSYGELRFWSPRSPLMLLFLSHLCEVRTTERPSLMMLRMQFHRARRALGSIPVVGSSCNNSDSQVNHRPQVQQKTQAEHHKEREEREHVS